MQSKVTLAGVEEHLAERLRRKLGETVSVELWRNPTELFAESEALATDLLLIGAEVAEPIPLAQRIYAVDRRVPVIILCPPARCQALKQTILFSPLLGSEVTVRSAAEEAELPALILETVARVQQRRNHQGALESVQQHLDTLVFQRPEVSHYLGRLLDFAPIGVLTIDGKGLIQSANRWIERFLKRGAKELLGEPLTAFFPNPERERLQDFVSRSAAAEDSPPAAFSIELPELRYVELTVAPLAYQSGEQGAIVLWQDVTERRIYEQNLLHQANFDALTGLPNRMLALDRLEQALADAQREVTKVLVGFIDLDHFKEINDTLGHAAGDRLLNEAAARLKACIRKNDTVARLGGDEFLIILRNLHARSNSEKVFEKILSALADPFRFENREMRISASIGLAIYPDDGKDCRTLLRNADLAMYRVKQAGRNAYRFFSADASA